MFLTDLSIKRPVVASVMSLVLVIFGLVTFQEIPTDELPDVQPPVVTIQTEYKGASAEIVDTQITQKIEDFVGGTPGLETIDSFSEDESSRITLTFKNDLDLNDVAKRAFQAAKKYKYSDFLRICGDRPLFDSNIYDELIQEHIKFKNDLTTTIFPRSVPVGFTGEIISTKAMKKLLSLTNNKIDREHVTRFFYKKCRRANI